MATTTADLFEEAYQRGLDGKPMTERLKRAAETDDGIYQAWRSGRVDGGHTLPDDEDTRHDTETEPETEPDLGPTDVNRVRQPGEAARELLERRRKRRKGITPISRRRSAGGRAYRAGRRVVAPVGTQLGHLLILALGLVALYLVLTSVGALSGVVGIVQKGVGWLVSPTASI